jgi:hypothetical protein
MEADRTIVGWLKKRNILRLGAPPASICVDLARREFGHLRD